MTDIVLFVCTGNTCRGPMAAAAFQHLCRQAGITGIDVDAAGLFVDESAGVTPHAREVLAEKQIPLPRLQSRQVTAKMIKRADLIVTMSDEHRDRIVEAFRGARLKTVPLMGFSDRGPTDVPDPFGCPIEVYRDCLDSMMPALENLAAQRYGLE